MRSWFVGLMSLVFSLTSTIASGAHAGKVLNFQARDVISVTIESNAQSKTYSLQIALSRDLTEQIFKFTSDNQGRSMRFDYLGTLSQADIEIKTPLFASKSTNTLSLLIDEQEQANILVDRFNQRKAYAQPNEILMRFLIDEK